MLFFNSSILPVSCVMLKTAKQPFFSKIAQALYLEAKKCDLCNMWPKIIPTEAFSNLSLIRFVGKHLEGRKRAGNIKQFQF